MLGIGDPLFNCRALFAKMKISFMGNNHCEQKKESIQRQQPIEREDLIMALK